MNIHPAHNTLLLQHSLAVPSVAARYTQTSTSRPTQTPVKVTQIVTVVSASSTELGVCKATVTTKMERIKCA